MTTNTVANEPLRVPYDGWATNQFALIESNGQDWYANWRTMLAHADPFLQEYVKGLLGDPDCDSSAYDQSSVLRYISGEKAPLLLLQGENDVRVPKEEAEQIASILRTRGGIVEAHYYPQEGHGWRKREDQIDSLRRTVEWFNRYLGTKAGTIAPPAN